jgi:hypothetical protein
MKPPVQIADVLYGAVAGVAATYPMTLLMEHLDGSKLEQPSTDLPPRTIIDEALNEVSGELPPEAVSRPATTIAHYGYGGLVGSMFPLFDRMGFESRLANGAAYGLGVWVASYCGLLPLFGSSARATMRPARINGIMIAAHVVWGVSLAVLTDRAGSTEE